MRSLRAIPQRSWAGNAAELPLPVGPGRRYNRNGAVGRKLAHSHMLPVWWPRVEESDEAWQGATQAPAEESEGVRSCGQAPQRRCVREEHRGGDLTRVWLGAGGRRGSGSSTSAGTGSPGTRYGPRIWRRSKRCTRLPRT
jgi:hypothetical protein